MTPNLTLQEFDPTLNPQLISLRTNFSSLICKQTLRANIKPKNLPFCNVRRCKLDLFPPLNKTFFVFTFLTSFNLVILPILWRLKIQFMVPRKRIEEKTGGEKIQKSNIFSKSFLRLPLIQDQFNKKNSNHKSKTD